MHATRPSFSRGGAGVLLGLALLGLHLLLLAALWPAPQPPGVMSQPPEAAGLLALQVRTLAAQSTPAADRAAAATAGLWATPGPSPRPRSPQAPAEPTAARPLPPRQDLPSRAPAAQAEVTQAQARALALALAPASSSAVAPALAPNPAGDTPAAAGDAPWPVFATRLPAAADLHYRLQRGDSRGHARLQWTPGEGGYLLRLDTAWPGQPARGAASRGLLDAAGVAPLRHAELQRERELRAVNFQREAGLITFSGPQAAYALRPGAQDRLSWLIQLPAMLEADAALAQPGTRLPLFVAGTRGDAEVWHFEVVGSAALELPAGAVAEALHLRREPTRPYDSRVELWLDPQRQHLPVRIEFTTLPGGITLQLALDRRPGLESEASNPR